MKKAKRISRTIFILSLALMTMMSGCNTLLNGKFEVEYLTPEQIEEGKKTGVETEIEYDPDFVQDVISYGDMDAQGTTSTVGSSKFESEYSKAFFIHDDLAKESEFLQTFQILDYVDNRYFVYIYQTFEYDAQTKKKIDDLRKKQEKEKAAKKNGTNVKESSTSSTSSTDGYKMNYSDVDKIDKSVDKSKLYTVLAVNDFTKPNGSGYIEIKRCVTSYSTTIPHIALGNTQYGYSSKDSKGNSLYNSEYYAMFFNNHVMCYKKKDIFDAVKRILQKDSKGEVIETVFDIDIKNEIEDKVKTSDIVKTSLGNKFSSFVYDIQDLTFYWDSTKDEFHMQLEFYIMPGEFENSNFDPDIDDKSLEGACENVLSLSMDIKKMKSFTMSCKNESEDKSIDKVDFDYLVLPEGVTFPFGFENYDRIVEPTGEHLFVIDEWRKFINGKASSVKESTKAYPVVIDADKYWAEYHTKPYTYCTRLYATAKLSSLSCEVVQSRDSNGEVVIEDGKIYTSYVYIKDPVFVNVNDYSVSKYTKSSEYLFDDYIATMGLNPDTGTTGGKYRFDVYTNSGRIPNFAVFDSANANRVNRLLTNVIADKDTTPRDFSRRFYNGKCYLYSIWEKEMYIYDYSSSNRNTNTKANMYKIKLEDFLSPEIEEELDTSIQEKWEESDYYQKVGGKNYGDYVGDSTRLSDTYYVTIDDKKKTEWTLILSNSKIIIYDENNTEISDSTLTYENCIKVLNGSKPEDVFKEKRIISNWSRLKEPITKGLHWNYKIEFGKDNAVTVKNNSGKKILDFEYTSKNIDSVNHSAIPELSWPSVKEFIEEHFQPKEEENEVMEAERSPESYSALNMTIMNFQNNSTKKTECLISTTPLNGISIKDIAQTKEVFAPVFQKNQVYETEIGNEKTYYLQYTFLKKGISAYGIYDNSANDSEYPYFYLGYDKQSAVYTEKDIAQAEVIPFKVIEGDSKLRPYGSQKVCYVQKDCVDRSEYDGIEQKEGYPEDNRKKFIDDDDDKKKNPDGDDEKKKPGQETSEKDTSERETSEKETSEKEKSEKETSEKEKSEKETSEKEKSEKETSEKKTSEKETSEKKTSEKETSEKKTSEKETSEKKTSEKDTSEKKTSEKETSEKKTSEKETSEKKTSEKETSEKKTSEKDTSEKKTSEKDTSEKKTSEKDTSEKKTSEKDTSEKKTSEKDTSEKKTSEKDTSEKKTSEKDTSEKKTSEKDTSEKKTSEKDTSEKKTSEKDTSEKKTSEKDTSEKKTSEKDTSEKKKNGDDGDNGNGGKGDNGKGGNGKGGNGDNGNGGNGDGGDNGNGGNGDNGNGDNGKGNKEIVYPSGGNGENNPGAFINDESEGEGWATVLILIVLSLIAAAAGLLLYLKNKKK